MPTAPAPTVPAPTDATATDASTQGNVSNTEQQAANALAGMFANGQGGQSTGGGDGMVM